MTLPAAVGGDEPLRYSVRGQPAGLVFDADTRALRGTPTSAGESDLVYRVEDADGDDVALSFSVGVVEPPPRPPPPRRLVAPEAVGTIDDVQLRVGSGSGTVDVADNFHDPDGQDLTFTAASDPSSVAGAAVAGSVVTITPASVGTATVTVTATDTDGLTASLAFGVDVAEAFPVVTVSAHYSQRTVGESLRYDLSATPSLSESLTVNLGWKACEFLNNPPTQATIPVSGTKQLWVGTKDHSGPFGCQAWIYVWKGDGYTVGSPSGAYTALRK